MWDTEEISEKDFSSVKRCTWEETVSALPGLFLPFLCGSTASRRQVGGPNSAEDTKSPELNKPPWDYHPTSRLLLM